MRSDERAPGGDDGAVPNFAPYARVSGQKGSPAMGAVGMYDQSGQAATLPWAYLRLPPFPLVAVRVLQLANNENVQLHQLCDLISSDPAFASEVLTVANSLLYAPRYPSTSIMQAVAVLAAKTRCRACASRSACALISAKP